MPILDIQKRARELGRIRIGQVVPTSNGKTRPEKLDRFRLTSHSRPLLEKVAELYGGEVAEWQPQGGGTKAWEVITDSKRLPIMVPPQPVTQWYEYWTGGGCKHRCDGHTNVLTDELCDPEDFGHQEAIKRPTTRLNVVLRDVEGIGVWRLETHGFNAAVELPDAAEFLAAAGGYVNGWVSLEPRTSKAEVPDRQNGGTKIQTRHFHVPIIEIDVTPSELMAGRGRVATPALAGPVPGPAALPAGGPAAVVNPYVEYHRQVEAAVSLDALSSIWEAARAQNLVGPTASATPEAAAFLDAFKARAQAVKPPAAEPAPAAAAEPQPDKEGAYEAEVVEEDTPFPDPGADVQAGADADAIWYQAVKAGGERGMGLSAVVDDFKARMGGLLPDDASAEELQHYLGLLTAGVAA
ncbi:hypothetical protein [Nocardioides sp. Arc9.136]|uniref:recombination directionality factor n=1 Tax=Nocardioides sp. Arc9.136 TaxID=2996826 RepID=UPI0026650340|nr:hypothetical protein [Nocardioides sp. Arc9.136]WKN47120.1 hypothetical protein OSR43_13840 [Nocardioides sp. Arc9.136]